MQFNPECLQSVLVVVLTVLTVLLCQTVNSVTSSTMVETRSTSSLALPIMLSSYLLCVCPTQLSTPSSTPPRPPDLCLPPNTCRPPPLNDAGPPGRLLMTMALNHLDPPGYLLVLMETKPDKTS